MIGYENPNLHWICLFVNNTASFVLSIKFGPGALPQHGFARDSNWSVASTSADLQPDEQDPEVTKTHFGFLLPLGPFIRSNKYFVFE